VTVDKAIANTAIFWSTCPSYYYIFQLQLLHYNIILEFYIKE